MMNNILASFSLRCKLLQSFGGAVAELLHGLYLCIDREALLAVAAAGFFSTSQAFSPSHIPL